MQQWNLHPNDAEVLCIVVLIWFVPVDVTQIMTYTILLCKDDVGSVVEPTSLLVWADVFLADFQGVIFHFLHDISTYLSATTQRVLRTTFMQKFKPKYACLHSKIFEVWIDRICVRYDWWRRLQPTSSVSPVCTCMQTVAPAAVNSCPHSAACMRQWTGSASVLRLYFITTTYLIHRLIFSEIRDLAHSFQNRIRW